VCCHQRSHLLPAASRQSPEYTNGQGQPTTTISRSRFSGSTPTDNPTAFYTSRRRRQVPRENPSSSSLRVGIRLCCTIYVQSWAMRPASSVSKLFPAGGESSPWSISHPLCQSPAHLVSTFMQYGGFPSWKHSLVNSTSKVLCMATCVTPI